jgi:hypothetical protein
MQDSSDFKISSGWPARPQILAPETDFGYTFLHGGPSHDDQFGIPFLRSDGAAAVRV